MNELTKEEAKIIRRLKSLEKIWPKHLQLFANGFALSLRRIPEDFNHRPTGPQHEIAFFINIKNDGGDESDRQ